MTIATADATKASALRKRAKPSITKLPPNVVPFGSTIAMKAAATSSITAPRLTISAAALPVGAEHQQPHRAEREHDFRKCRVERHVCGGNVHQFTKAADLAAASSAA